MHRPIRVLIIDDEEHIRIILKVFLSHRSDIVLIGECENISDAKIMIKNSHPDVILLDIKLGNDTGFDLLSMFPNPTFKVIFITAYEKYAIDALKAGALDYLMKPIDEEELNLALNKLHQYAINPEQYQVATEHWQNKPKRITFNTHEGVHILWMEEIMYCEANGGYTTFYINDGSKLMISKPLKEYESILPATAFLRIHQSYIVNINYATLFKKDNCMILMKNPVNGQTKEIPVSTRKREEILNILSQLK